MKPRIVAHKGDMQNAPESTFAAFRSAIDKGADTIEFDVHLTKDNQLVIHHDYYLGRTEQAQGAIEDFTLAELRDLDIGSWFSPRFAEERIMTLPEVLALGQGNIRFEIDMRTPDLQLLNLILADIDRFGVSTEVELTSVHTPLLTKAKQIAPNLAIGIFFSPFPDWMTNDLGQRHIIAWMKLMDAQVAHLHVPQLTSTFVDMLHEQGFLAHGVNLDTKSDIETGLAASVDQFSTDVLDLALSLNSR